MTDGRRRPRAGARLSDHVALGVLTSSFPPELVDEVIDAAGVREQRVRRLPARMMAYYTLGCALWMNESQEEVFNLLTEGLDFLACDGDDRQAAAPTTSSLAAGREKLGIEVPRMLFEKVAGPVGTTDTPGVFWRDLRVCAVDGMTVDVQATPVNVAFFGGPSNEAGDGPYPQMRVLALAECGTRSVMAVQSGPYTTGEQRLFDGLLPHLGPDMLTICDRNFLGYEQWKTATATGAKLLWRASAAFGLRKVRALPDGSYIARLNPPAKARRHGDKPIEVRVIDYSILFADGSRSEVFTLVTNLLDPATAPIDELAELYAARWQVEIAFKGFKTTLRGSGVALRAKTPTGAAQELWALLAVYQAIRHLICHAVTGTGISPNRVSFTRALRAARRQATAQAAFSPSAPG